MLSDYLIGKLSKLSKADAEAARAILELAADGGEDSIVGAPGPRMVYKVISDALEDKLSIKPVPYSVASKKLGKTKFNTSAQDLCDYITSAFSPRDTTEFRSCLVFCINALLRWMSRLNIHISQKSVAGVLYRVPSVIDRAYPGYIECGGLKFLIRATKSRAKAKPKWPV